MTYDKNSFLAGISVGRSLKGWASTKGGAAPDETWDTSNPQEVYRRLRPSDWLTMPTPNTEEIWFLLHIPADGAEFISFRVTCTEKGNDGKTLPYYVSVIDVQAGERVVVSHNEVASGGQWEAKLYGSDFGNATSDGMTQALIKVSGYGVGGFTWWYHSAGNYSSADCNVVESAACLPKLTNIGYINARGNVYGGGSLCRSRTKFTALYGSNSITSTGMSFNNMHDLMAVLALDVSGWKNTAQFQYCYRLLAVPVLQYDNDASLTNAFAYCTSMRKAPKIVAPETKSWQNIFGGCSAMVEARDLEMPGATNIARLFQNCYALEKLPKITAPKAATCNEIFKNCRSAEYSAPIDLPAATNIGSICAGCEQLKALPPINAPVATTATSIFDGCYAAESYGEINLPTATALQYAFRYCRSLQELPALDIPAATNIQYLFGYCNAAAKSGRINAPNASASSTFTSCYALRNINLNSKSGYSLGDAENLAQAVLDVTGTSVSIGTPPHTLQRLIIKSDNTAFAGTALPLSATSIGRGAALELFNALPTISSTKTITLSQTPAAKDLTDDDVAIVVAKGWTVSK